MIIEFIDILYDLFGTIFKINKLPSLLKQYLAFRFFRLQKLEKVNCRYAKLDDIFTDLLKVFYLIEHLLVEEDLFELKCLAVEPN